MLFNFMQLRCTAYTSPEALCPSSGAAFLAVMTTLTANAQPEATTITMSKIDQARRAHRSRRSARCSLPEETHRTSLTIERQPVRYPDQSPRYIFNANRPLQFACTILRRGEERNVLVDSIAPRSSTITSAMHQIDASRFDPVVLDHERYDHLGISAFERHGSRSLKGSTRFYVGG